MTKNNPFPQPICEQIWNSKYRLITPNPDITNDETVEDTWLRIATACADAPNAFNDIQPLSDLPSFETKKESFYEALSDFGFVPAGRIVAGAGSGRRVTLFNCYVMGTIPDSMTGIFDMLKEAALTMQQGGGIGYDFSTLRPKNSPVKGVDADASGPLSFMDVWDSMCRTIMSAGSRRGAMMATMSCDHPDIFDFVHAKKDPNRLRMFNVSVLCTDDFMEAVINDDIWKLVHIVPPQLEPDEQPEIHDHNGYSDKLGKNLPRYVHEVVKARDLWESMMTSTYNQAEPGVLFIDRINDMNNLKYMEIISSTNPCGEQPLPPYGACLLGSINLSKLVTDPFSLNAQVDYEMLGFLTEQAVEMLDSVIDISNFPLEAQRQEALEKRRMGLGITGLANMLFMLDIRYGSKAAEDVAQKVMKHIAITAYRRSIELARMYGPCPATKTKEQRLAFIDSGYMKQMPYDIRQDVVKYGIRNALLTSIAPTGTISLYAGNVSSGVEPVFAHSYTRKVLENDGVTRREELVEDYGLREYRKFLEKVHGVNHVFDPETDLPESYVTAQTLTPNDHLVMQAAVQRWVDSSISKTINCPEDISYEDFKEVYMNAYKMDCKGCTTYRPNAVTGSVLSVEPKKKEKPVEIVEEPKTSITVSPLPRNKSLFGQTYKLKWDDTNFYVTINNYLCEDGTIIPFEIFINTQNMSHFQWTVALTRMMSSVFRRGGDISFVIEDLKSIMDPNGGAWIDGKYVPSFIALLGSTLEDHLKDISVFGTPVQNIVEQVEPQYPESTSKPMQCPKCHGFNIQISGGCPTCGDCGHSKCG